MISWARSVDFLIVRSKGRTRGVKWEENRGRNRMEGPFLGEGKPGAAKIAGDYSLQIAGLSR